MRWHNSSSCPTDAFIENEDKNNASTARKMLKSSNRNMPVKQGIFLRRWPGVRQTQKYLTVQELGHHLKYLKPTPFILFQSKD